VTSVTPQNKPPHNFIFDAVDLASDYTPPSVAGISDPSTRYFYNADRAPTRVLLPDAQAIDFGYDTAGRLNALTTPRGQTAYNYNDAGCNCPGAGKLSSIIAPGPDGEVISYTYDGDLLTSTSWSGPVAGSVGRSYDSDFRPVTLTVNGQDPESFGYDQDSLLVQSGALTLARAPQNGRLTGTSLGNVSDTWSYNDFSEPVGYTATFSGSPVLSATYTRDKLGQMVTRNETIQGVTDS